MNPEWTWRTSEPVPSFSKRYQPSEPLPERKRSFAYLLKTAGTPENPFPIEYPSGLSKERIVKMQAGRTIIRKKTS